MVEVAGLLLLLLIIGFAGIYWFVHHERQRDLDHWQLVLGVMADEKSHAINGWVGEQFAVLEELAQNGALQLYTQVVGRQGKGRGDGLADSDIAAQLDYLSHLIMATAERTGFIDQGPSSSVKANIAYHARDYIILFSSDDKVIAATPGAPKPWTELQKAVKDVQNSGHRLFFNIYRNPEGVPLAGFLVPVQAIQKGDPGHATVGVLFGARDAREGLFPLLRSNQAMIRSDEACLVQKEGGLILYLSPLKDGSGPLEKALSLNMDIASAQAIKEPGSSGISTDYRGEPVIFTSRPFHDLPWVLVQKIDLKEAMAGLQVHQRFLWIILCLGLFLVIALLFLAWRYGDAVRARENARLLEERARRIEEQARLLQAVSDNIKDMVLLMDADLKALFGNCSLGNLLSLPVEDLKGKGLVNLFGPGVAASLEPLCLRILSGSRVASAEFSMGSGSWKGIYCAVAVAVNYPGDEDQAVLLTLYDITWLKEEQEKKEQLSKALVSALMRSIDLYDPHSANHSANTAVVASAVAEAMDLELGIRNTVETAANLCNIGKLSIPRNILTKDGPLSPDEEEIIRKEPLFAEEILKDVPFEGPVVETIVQKNEWLDGSGYPRGLKGDQIILPARIVSVANAFVAMISPRSYRDALTPDEALDEIQRLSGRQFDKKAVAALLHVARNFVDWSAWNRYGTIKMRGSMERG